MKNEKWIVRRWTENDPLHFISDSLNHLQKAERNNLRGPTVYYIGFQILLCVA